MGLFTVVGLAVAGLYMLSIVKTANAVSKLMYDLRKVQIYKVTGSGVIFRLFVDFTNTKATPVLVQMLSLEIFLDNKKLGIVKASDISIPARQFSSKTIDVEITFAKLALVLGDMAYKWFRDRTITPPQSCRISGEILAENITVRIDKTIPFSGESLV